MELELKIYRNLCATSIFSINGIEADYDDFGQKYDRNSGKAEDHACGNMQFTGDPSTPEVLYKYKINEDEYREVVSKLENGLSFGCCGWCV